MTSGPIFLPNGGEVKNSILEEDLASINKEINARGDWAGATILITGCAGFLGFYFMHYFARYGTVLGVKKVIGLDSFLLGKPSWLESLKREYPEFIDLQKFDISVDKLEMIMGANQARYVIHGASVASPVFYRKYPIETIDANIWGLRNILEFYKASSEIKGLLFFSSSEIYGDPYQNFIPTDEEYRGNVSCHGPRACYDESKRFGETLCWIYAKKFRMPIIVARPFNNYGPGMSPEDKRLPADFAKHIIDGDDMVIFSDGTPTRTFCYVSDAIAGYLMCLTYGKYDYFNIGTDGPEVSVREFAKIFLRLGADVFGYKGVINFDKNIDPEYMIDNPNRRCPAITKARIKLGYHPKISVAEGVARYLKFLKQELAK